MLPYSVDKSVDPKCPRAMKIATPVPVPRYTVEQLRGLFWRYDSNRDGRLSRKELKTAFNHLGACIPSWRALRALQYADDNDDGYISEEEIDNLVNYTVKLSYVVIVK